ncbi:hypothetical protein EYF80_027561 [Liparis tanakae]|uniref:Uncharacterized protein n=1 Tax=Liparis tanakae TaxID=230148 RepID=A0A4Z2H9A1_9TELE|nr:hypothetical protein EYF80_027561 [Liparis tanakae]
MSWRGAVQSSDDEYGGGVSGGGPLEPSGMIGSFCLFRCCSSALVSHTRRRLSGSEGRRSEPSDRLPLPCTGDRPVTLMP